MPGITYARIESAQLGLLAETGGGARLISDASLEGDQAGLPLWSLLTTRSIEVSAPVLRSGEPVGSITLFSQTPELRTRILSTLWTTLAGALFAVTAGLIVAIRLAGEFSRPIVALAGLMREVHDNNDFSAKADIRAEGEVADLVAGFDTMLAGIRERDARISAQVEGLESEVSARTQELVVARDAAETANAAKSDFLAVMSHEIRTPLNGILALSEMLSNSDLPARQQRYADVISKSGKSLLSIINDILDFSKVEAGKMELESVEVDLSEAAEDVASLFSEKAAAKGLDLAVFVDPRLPQVLADPTRLRQIIGNLVNNAIKFTDSGGVLVAIDPDPSDPHRVRVAVHDTGPGIPEAVLPTLFEAFTQADQSTTRVYGGTGLGLAICDRLVRSMDGVWDLTSTVGAGSCFAFSAPFPRHTAAGPAKTIRSGWTVALRTLPLQTHRALSLYLDAWGLSTSDSAGDPGFCGAVSAASARDVVVCDNEEEAAALIRRRPDICAIAKPLRQGDIRGVLALMQAGERPQLIHRAGLAGVVTTFPGARVLVVDDSEVNREVASEALSRLGAETAFASDGQQAVERLRTQAFDMVLMDGSMPVLDGFEATRMIREEESQTGRPRAVIIALTAHVVGSGADAWRLSGMDGVIYKPFTLSDLTRELSRFCSERAVRAESGEGLRERTPSEPTDIGLFDHSIRNDLIEMVRSGRGDFVERVHALYAANAPLRLADMLEGEAAGDADALARAAHALKSMSLSLGASAVALEAGRIETAVRSGTAISEIGTASLGRLLEQTLEAMPMIYDAAAAPVSPQTALADAIAHGELHLVYQPLVERTGRMSGKVEALVRWTHPQHGRLSPDDFIPRLEAGGVISQLTDFVLAQAMIDLAARPDLLLSVNASASEFQHPEFAGRIRAAAEAAGFPSHRLEIEVTETAMLDVEAARKTIDSLRAAGFGVALDDFGAGYTSLHALRELKFTTLKIDKSFVDGCTGDTASAAIIHAVIGVGRALGMKVVCEGVETSDQAEFLRIAGAHYMQGYHFYRPMAAEALPGLTRDAA